MFRKPDPKGRYTLKHYETISCSDEVELKVASNPGSLSYCLGGGGGDGGVLPWEWPGDEATWAKLTEDWIIMYSYLLVL